MSLAGATMGCGDGEATGFPVNAKARGELVAVDKSETTVGFARGTLRVTENTKAFKISKTPITKKEYRACQQARVCGEPKVEECSNPELAQAAFNGVDSS
ncbi:MAG TPA: hypothetical protein VIV60_02295, partial [Polyangiaceae bacterium]